MNDRETTEAAIAVSLWAIAFCVGMMIGCEADKALGLVIMAAATLVLAVVMLEEYRLERKQQRIDKLVENDCRQIEEVLAKGGEDDD